MTIPNWLKVLATFLAGVAATIAAFLFLRPRASESPAQPIIDQGNAEKAKIDEKVKNDSSQQLADDFNKARKP